jgi:lysophospholipase L1-like esterase
MMGRDSQLLGAIALSCFFLSIIPPSTSAGGAGGPVVVVIGDHITVGETMVRDDPNNSQSSVISQLGSMLNVSFFNRVMTGDISRNMLARFEADVISLRPDVVILTMARDDMDWLSVQESESNYLNMISLALANGAHVILVTVPVNDSTSSFLSAVNGWAMDLSYRNVHVIDSWALLSDADDNLAPEYQVGDGVRLSDAGYHRIADELFSVVFNSNHYGSGDGKMPWKDPLIGWGLIGGMGAISGLLYLQGRRTSKS